MRNYIFHNLSVEKTLRILNTNLEKGLDSKNLEERYKKYGYNKFSEGKKTSKLEVFLNQFKSPLIYILLIAGVITFALGKWTDTLVILLSVIVNAIFGYWEENKVSNILEKLKNILETKTIVLRDGHKKQILQSDLVPGDIIFLTAGEKVPADARIVKCENLKISEAVLTGEWAPSSKSIEVQEKGAPLAERKNMAYMGSLVEGGNGEAVVVATGSNTEAGKIASLISQAEEKQTPLQKKLADFSKTIGMLIGTICVFIFAGGFLREGNLLEMFEASVAIAVGGIPEALPIVMTVILAIGTERILRKKGLIRKLSSVETLGSTQIICFDKTRTLTKGEMATAEIVAEDRKSALRTAVLCNETIIENPEDNPINWRIKGAPTDVALLKSGIEEGLLKPRLEAESEEIALHPFDTKLKYQLSLRKENGSYILYIAGAPERIAGFSKEKDSWQKKIENLTKKGYRVIGLGYKKIKEKDLGQDLENLVENINFQGLLALKDPLRDDVVESIKICKRAGMEPIMATGDHKLTASAIAKEVGLEVDSESVLEGSDLDKISDEDLLKKLSKIKVYARVEPKHKLRIVSLWQQKGKVIAMTGDGVNDAPALKKADIGVALGSGTEVAKEASDLVLLDDSFSVIIKTIEEGRVILDNLRKSIAYVLADSFASVILVGISKIFFGWPLPILAPQILWNNVVEDTLPNIAYAFEPKEEDVMKRKPSAAKTPLLTKEMKILIFGTGLIDQFIALFVFWYLWGCKGMDLDYVRTLVFATICIDTAFVVFSYKNLRKNIWNISLFSNKWLNISALVVFFSLALAVYFPPLQQILQTVPLGMGSWILLIGVGLTSVLLIEITKWYFISRHKTEE